MAKQNDNEIDFNNPDAFKKVFKEISKEKLKGNYNVGDIPKKVIAFLTGNVKWVVIVAIYLLACGLFLNIKWIYNLFQYHLIGTLIGITLLILVILIRKHKANIIKSYYSLKLKIRLSWEKLKK